MKRRRVIRKTGSRRGGVAVELAAAAVALLVPALLALAELGRLDRELRRLQYTAQRRLLEAACRGNAEPGFRVLAVEAQATVSASPAARRVMGAAAVSTTLRRRYWIATGSGHGVTGD